MRQIIGMRRGTTGLITILLSLAFCFRATSQTDSLSNSQPKTDCEASLAIATGEFNAGRFFSLPSILAGCLENGFTKEQKVRAYILLCQVYLINDDPNQAEASYLQLLQADPEYIADIARDPVDVVYLSKKFTTRPVFTPHLRLGSNISLSALIHRTVPQGERGELSYSKKPKFGFQIGGGMDWNISDRVSLCSELTFARRSFEEKITKIYDDDIVTAQPKIAWIDWPLYLKYQDTKGNWRPYAYLGYSAHLRLSSKAKLTNFNIDPDEDGGPSTQKPTEGPDVVFTNKQNLLNQSLVLGGGMKYKIGKNYLFADLRMLIGLSNLTNEDRIYVDDEGVFDPNTVLYGYASDLYRLNSINISVGFIFPVYNPRKKGGWQPKGLLNKILNGNTSIE